MTEISHPERGGALETITLTSNPSSAPLLPEGPALPGLRYRPYAGEEDIPALVELYGAVDRADANPEVWRSSRSATSFATSPTSTQGGTSSWHSWWDGWWAPLPSAGRTRARASASTVAVAGSIPSGDVAASAARC